MIFSGMYNFLFCNLEPILQLGSKNKIVPADSLEKENGDEEGEKEEKEDGERKSEEQEEKYDASGKHFLAGLGMTQWNRCRYLVII